MFFAGIMTVDHYISLLARLIEDNEPALVAARVDRSVTLVTELARGSQMSLM